MNNKKESLLDKPAFTISVLLVLAISIPLIVVPDVATAVINAANDFVIKYFGSYYMLFGLASLAICFYISFSKYGAIVLGGPEAKPEYKFLTWLAMNFCAGVGSGVILWGTTEWIYYFQAPPLGVEPLSNLAAEQSTAYCNFHWGMIPCSFYVIGAAAVGYQLFVRKQNVLKLNEACSSVLGKHTNTLLGKLINLSFIFGLIGASATTLGLSTPMVAASLAYVFGVEYSMKLQVISLVIVTAIFTTSVTLGMKKGIANLSNLNFIIMALLLVITFFCGDTLFMLDNATTSLGYMMNNFFRMSTWMDPVGGSGFAQSWTVFYWAFYLGFAPFMALFYAKISYGRTIRQMLITGILGGSLTYWLHQWILGGYGLSLQLNGKMDVVGNLATRSQGQTVVDILANLPGSKFVILILGILCIIFLATQFDSAAYILSTSTQKKLDEDGEPALWLRLFWALMLFILPIGFLAIGAPLDPLKTMVVVLSLPLSVIMIFTVWAFFKMVNEDKAKGIITMKEPMLSGLKLTSDKTDSTDSSEK